MLKKNGSPEQFILCLVSVWELQGCLGFQNKLKQLQRLYSFLFSHIYQEPAEQASPFSNLYIMNTLCWVYKNTAQITVRCYKISFSFHQSIFFAACSTRLETIPSQNWVKARGTPVHNQSKTQKQTTTHSHAHNYSQFSITSQSHVFVLWVETTVMLANFQTQLYCHSAICNDNQFQSQYMQYATKHNAV